MKFIAPLFATLLLAGCANHVTCTPLDLAQARCHEPNATRWPSSDGKSLPAIAEMPPYGTRIKGVVILVPGMDGTLCDYRSLTHALVQHGYAVHGFEHRTMKYDPVESAQGTARDWQTWVRDLQKFTGDVRRQHPGVPLYVHGHSFGAVVALQALAEDSRDATKRALSPDGVILQSPAYALLPAQNPWLTNAMLWPFGWMRIPQLALMESKKLEMTSSKEWNCAWMRSEDRVAKGYTLGWFRQVWKMGHKARAFSETGQLPPTLVLRGEKDFIALGGKPGQFLAQKPEGYAAYVGHLGRKPNAEKNYEEGRHLLTEGPGRQRVIRDIVAWLDAKH